MEWVTPDASAAAKLVTTLKDFMVGMNHWRWVMGALGSASAPAFHLGFELAVATKPLRVQLLLWPELDDHPRA